ncbi:HK97 gp10 family phage protein [Desulfosporosinus youngiae]|uniref:HK97 gp10 family phage protein n=1 Tax=Desulfosporosinus youngiae DSM 17734 TaxID=768710 RepID=H5XZU8_9FIRM|nr:HK97 gp10 family phage protein [Desulfosporosinus youngiae]EHQ92144.1 hypothetical protein DesyoDRAFT_5213 [Desulfosporosinus youngiae DSM 17734]
MARWGSFRFEEFERLAQSFQKALDERVMERFIREFLSEMAMRSLRKIKMRMLADHGDLRRKWQVGNVTRTGDAYVIEIFNNLEYASFVEYGFRSHWVPGHWEGNKFIYDRSVIHLTKEAKVAYKERYGSLGMYVGNRKIGWVSGKFMMTISMQEIERDLPKYLERKQIQLLEQIMNGRPPRR